MICLVFISCLKYIDKIKLGVMSTVLISKCLILKPLILEIIFLDEYHSFPFPLFCYGISSKHMHFMSCQGAW